MNFRENATAVSERPVATAAGRAALFSFTLLCLGHFSVDLYSSALGALQPLLVEKFHTSLTQVGILGGVLVFCVLSDAAGVRLSLGPLPHAAVHGAGAGGGGGVHLLAGARAFLRLAAADGAAGRHGCGRLSSAGIRAGRAWRRHQQAHGAMAVFVSAGTLGFALGPTYFSADRGPVGLSQLLWAAIPGVLVTSLSAGFVLPGYRGAGTPRTARL